MFKFHQKFQKKNSIIFTQISLPRGKDEKMAETGVGDNVQISSKISMYTSTIICWCQYEHFLPLNLPENWPQKFIPKMSYGYFKSPFFLS